jgi:hypothetical protein
MNTPALLGAFPNEQEYFLREMGERLTKRMVRDIV